MQTLQQSYRGLSLVFELNWDRILIAAMMAGALTAAAYIANL